MMEILILFNRMVVVSSTNDKNFHIINLMYQTHDLYSYSTRIHLSTL